MTRALRRVDRWLLAPAAPDGLAVFRMVCGGFALTYLVVRLPVFLALRNRDPDGFQPVGVLTVLTHPVPDPVVIGILAVAVLFGVGFTVGRYFSWCGPGFAVAFLLLTTYRSSWGQLLWFENLLALHLIVVGCARSADTRSFDARRAPTRNDGSSYGWPLRLAAMVTALTYVLAGIAKLRIGGLGWISGDTLRNHVAYSAARLEVLGGRPSPLAGVFVRFAWLSTPLAVATLIIELGAPFALASRRLLRIWVVGAWSMHASIALLMFVVFPYPLLLAAFVPSLLITGNSSSRFVRPLAREQDQNR